MNINHKRCFCVNGLNLFCRAFIRNICLNSFKYEERNNEKLLTFFLEVFSLNWLRHHWLNSVNYLPPKAISHLKTVF